MKFDEWFKEQFRSLPMNMDERRKISRRESDLRSEADMLREQLQRDDRLTEKYRAARYAWNCSDDYKAKDSP